MVLGRGGDGPFLQAALLCEKVLVEQDGVKTAVRMIDRLTHTVAGPAPPEDMEPFNYALALLIRFKSGAARGTMSLEVRLEKPSGESRAPLTQTLVFEGEDDRGIDVIANLTMKIDQQGLYWFNVALDEQRVTRIPFRVIYMPQIVRQTGASSDGQPDG